MLIHIPPEGTVLAMGVHKNTIPTGLLEPGSVSPLVDKISADDESGPTGYELHRMLDAAGMHREVIAPSLIPSRAWSQGGDRSA